MYVCFRIHVCVYARIYRRDAHVVWKEHITYVHTRTVSVATVPLSHAQNSQHGPPAVCAQETVRWPKKKASEQTTETSEYEQTDGTNVYVDDRQRTGSRRYVTRPGDSIFTRDGFLPTGGAGRDAAAGTGTGTLASAWGSRTTHMACHWCAASTRTGAQCLSQRDGQHGATAMRNPTDRAVAKSPTTYLGLLARAFLRR